MHIGTSSQGECQNTGGESGRISDALPSNIMLADDGSPILHIPRILALAFALIARSVHGLHFLFPIEKHDTRRSRSSPLIPLSMMISNPMQATLFQRQPWNLPYP
jgi:hypothetical protein